MAGRLRQAIENWVYEKIQPEGGPGYWERVHQRSLRWKEVLNQWVTTATPGRSLLAPIAIACGIAFIFMGWERLIWWMTPEAESAEKVNISQKIADIIHEQMIKPAPREIVETLGALITEPVLTLFEQYAGRDDVDPKEFARAFHGFMISLNIASGLADTVVEGVTAGQVEGAGRMIQSMYWSLGLGFLGWQTLAPLLTAGLQPGLERYYQHLYRPARFTAGDLRDLYALGEISENQLKEEAKYAGWRDSDIARWVKLAYRTLNESDIWQAYHQHDLTEAQATARLRALGWSPQDIPLLFKLNPPKTESEVKDFSASTARKAYREALMSKAELLQVLKDLDYSDKEALIIVQLEDLSRVQDTKSLAVGQIKAAWSENVITDPEANHWLELAGFAQTERDVLLRTWKAEAIPEYRKINLGTVTGAYVEGIINRAAAQTRLTGIGLTVEDAKLELDLAEKRNPEAFGVVVPPTRRLLTPGSLADLLEVGLITSSQMTSRLTSQGYSSEDARLLTDAALMRLKPAPRPMPQVSVERAYVAGVIDRTTALSKLNGLGISSAEGAIILDTLERENPEVFGAAPEIRARQLTASALEDLHVAGLITSAQMKSYLITLNYSDADAVLLVKRAEQLAAPFVRPLTEPLIERAYIAKVITRDEAKRKIVSLAYTPEEAETILTTIDTENAAAQDASLVGSSRQPSITALAMAVKNTIITEDYYLARAHELGYTQEDALIYLVLAIQEERKATHTLSVSQITSAYDAGIMTWSTALTRITGQGYSDEDARLILRTRKDLIENTDTWYSLSTGDLNPYEALNQLISAGYSDNDIYNAFAKLTPSILASVDINLADLPSILEELPGGQ